MTIKHTLRFAFSASAAVGLALSGPAGASNCGMNQVRGGPPAGYAYGAPMRPMPPMPRYRAYGYRQPTPGYGMQARAYPAPQAPGGPESRASWADQSVNATSAVADAVQVAVSQMRFDPPELTIKAGETVTWSQDDGMPHTVTSTDGVLSSPTLYRGSKFSFTFDKPGTYDYVCSLHPSMRGLIVVE